MHQRQIVSARISMYLLVTRMLSNQTASLKFRTNWNRITRDSSLITKLNSCILVSW